MVGRRSGEETRGALLAAAVDSLRELRTVDLLTAVGTREIARRAGVSAATLFHHFGSVEGLCRELVEQIYRPQTPASSDIPDKVTTVAQAQMPLHAGLNLHRSEFARLVADREHRLRVGLWAFGGDEARAAYGDYQRVSDAYVVDQALRVFASWGREVRAPFDATMFVAAQAALLSGSVIRHNTDPSAIDVQRFAQMASALSIVMLRTPTDRRDLDDLLAEVNYYPLQGGTRSTSDRAGTSRVRILEAAAALWEQQAYDKTSIDQIARAAGLSVSTVYSLVVSKVDLAVAVLMHQAGDLGAEHATLEDALLEVAELLARRASFVAPYVTRLAIGHRTAEHDSLLITIEAGLAAAQAQGRLRGDLDVADLARTVLLALSGRVLADPSEGPTGAVEHVMDVVVRGLRN